MTYLFRLKNRATEISRFNLEPVIPFKEEVIAENYPNFEHQRESNSYGTNEFVFMSTPSPSYQNMTDSLGSNQPPTFSHYQNLLGNRLEPVTAG